MALTGKHVDRVATIGGDSKRTMLGRAIAVAVGVLWGLFALVGSVWRPDALAGLTLVPPWCWLVGGLLIVLMAWQVRLPRIAALLAAFWFLFALGCVEELPSMVRLAARYLPGQPPPGQSLRIVSLNAAGSEQCVVDLKATNADIVLLQEAPGAEALARMTATLFAETGEFCTAGDVAILARGEVTGRISNPRGTFVRAQVRLPDGREVECVSLRLAPPPARLDPWTAGFWSEHRQLRALHRRQLAQVMAAVGSEPDDSPIVIGGDFNTMPRDTALGEMRRRFTDAFAKRGVGWGATGTNDWPLFRVDQIWTSSRITPLIAFTQKTHYSDHRIVICDADVPP